MVKIRNFASFTVILILTLLFVNCTEDSPTTPSIDYVAPYVEWVNPSNSAELSGTVEFSFSVYDENGIDSVKLYINGTLFLGSANASPPATAGGDKGGVTLSDFKLTPAITSCSIRNPPLYSPPCLRRDRLYYVRGDDYTNTDEVVFTFCKNEPAGADSPFSKGGIEVGFYLVNSSDTTITIEWNTLDYEDGVYILEARAWDTSGNLGTSPSLMVNVKNNDEPPPEDRTPPVVNWVSPEPGTEVDGIIDLQFDALDNTSIDYIKVYINGALPAGYTLAGQDNEARYSVSWHTEDYADGDYDIEVRAFDTAGNVGSVPAVSLTVLNYPPREPQVIWVRDDYETIQDAVWHSEDGDTIIVRRGIYREWVEMFDKNVSLISESGPEVTFIDGSFRNLCLSITGSQDTTMIVRGFTFIKNSSAGCVGINASPKIVNNIFTGPGNIEDPNSGLEGGWNAAIVRNNLFINIDNGVELAHSWGDFSNNMLIQISVYAFWNSANEGQPLIPDYNLFWDISENFGHIQDMEIGAHNIFDQAPQFMENSYNLRDNSPGKNQGKPDIMDLDGTRSDIGVYGGPYAYPIR
ncbi:hypothetical protein K9N50_03180 [bacterium]|nr:hypothetical protein [bacterium]